MLRLSLETIRFLAAAEEENQATADVLKKHDRIVSRNQGRSHLVEFYYFNGEFRVRENSEVPK